MSGITPTPGSTSTPGRANRHAWRRAHAHCRPHADAHANTHADAHPVARFGYAHASSDADGRIGDPADWRPW